MTRKFDVVIGNPPYQRGKNSSFYVKFIQRSAEVLEDGGHFQYVIPNRFLLPHTQAAKALASNFQLEHLRANVSSEFPGIGTTIGTVRGVRSADSHSGKATLQLSGGVEISFDPTRLTVPSQATDLAGVSAWSQIARLDSYEVVKQRPESGEFVFVGRQWRSKNGAIYMDATAGDHPEGRTDGRYIKTDNPQAVATHLRLIAGPAIHRLFGDQMNIWPCLWDHLPTKEAWEKHRAI